MEDFWAIYNNIQLASKLSSGCDYALFKVSSASPTPWDTVGLISSKLPPSQRV